MLKKYEIDLLNFSKDLDNYSEKFFINERSNSSLGNEIIQEKLEGDESESYRNSEEQSFSSDMIEQNKDIINGNEIFIEDTIKTLNFCINYLKMKEINSSEKFFIYFNTKVDSLMNYLMEMKNYNDMKNLSYKSEEK